MGRVENKVVLVTGAGRGLGLADARLLAKEGARVVATDVDESGAAELLAAGAEFRLQDVSDEGGWKQTIDDILSAYGRLDVLVNNAGIIHVGDPVNFDLHEWRAMCAVNVEGVMLGCKYAIPAMIDGGGGSIVNMSSIAAGSGLYFYGGYCASKGAVAAYSRAVAVYCAQNKLNIRCNSVHPGGIDTPINQGLADELGERMGNMRLPPGSPVSGDGPKMRMGEPEDIAFAVLYLASDESKYMSGSELHLDNTASVTAAVVE
tara:strand:- start:2849 stop:3631 length:783 start_codon:yes stop_codon:yes gene_type:complete